MVKAFVFGKFLPFHKGHEAMIYFALSKCDFLTVLICCSDQEHIPDYIRKNWLENAFPEQKKIEFKIFNYSEKDFPNTSVSSSEVSKIWAVKFKALFPDYTLLVTSEPYGDYVAGFMGIQHIPFDLERKHIPISASAIRENVFVNWDYLPNTVKAYYIKKVVILGSESTGKTTLTNRLAKHFKASFVLEAAREIIKNSNEVSLGDLYKVATEHAKKIELQTTGNSPLLIIDTDVYITQSYANYIFNKKLELTDRVYQLNAGDLYLYLNNDVEFIQDGTRLSESERDQLDLSHRKIFAANHIRFHEITGDWQRRFEASVKLIERIIFGYNTDSRDKVN